MSHNSIKVRDVVDIEFISTRSLANSIFELVESTPAKQVTIDFTDIEGATRSFMDQIRANIIKTKKSVKIVNLSQQLEQMQKIVSA